jgi:hypothetical protein
MKLTRNEDVLSENDENKRACNPGNKEGEHGPPIVLSGNPPLDLCARPVLHKSVDR